MTCEYSTEGRRNKTAQHKNGKMNASERISLVEFHQQLLNYCIQGAGCTVQEKDFLSRLEKLIVQRDACLAQMIKKKESERMCSEDISDLEHQHAELVERMESIEKKCKLLALEQLSIDDEERPAKQLTRPDALQSAVANSSDQLNEKILNRFLRKYCNIYTQFTSADTLSAFSLADNQLNEFDLKDNNVSDLREKMWSNFAAGSAHLSSWEQML